MDNQGWIKLHRSFINWEWFDEPNMVWLFMKCLLLANYEDKKWHGISIKRGSFITSYTGLSSKKAKVSVQMIRTMLERLKLTGEITIKTTNQYTHISINNYDKYQENNTQNNKQITNDQQTDNKRITTTKEYKEVKKEKNIYKHLPEMDEISLEDMERVAQEYSVSLRNIQDLWQDIYGYCHSKGEKYVNFYTTLQVWTRRAIKEKKITRMVTAPILQPEPDYDPKIARDNLEKLREMKDKILNIKSI